MEADIRVDTHFCEVGDIVCLNADAITVGGLNMTVVEVTDTKARCQWHEKGVLRAEWFPKECLSIGGTITKIWYYQLGNQASEAAVRDAAAKDIGGYMIVPRSFDGRKMVDLAFLPESKEAR